MRRVLTFLTAIALCLVSLGVGVFTADLPFWQRALQLPLPSDGVYLPVARIGSSAPTALPRGLTPGSLNDAPALDTLAIDQAVDQARAAGSRALLVMHQDRLQVERYFLADDANSLLPAALVARVSTAMAVGIALAEKRIDSLDTPVARYLPEWDDEPRGRITMRQLLEETSGLETGGDIRGLLYRSPWDDLAALPAFATARGVRMLLGNDFESSALGFRLDHEPGGFRNVSPANTQLAAVILERATGIPFEHYVDDRLWRAVGAGDAEMQLDRRAGMPAAHCCWRATARDMMLVLGLLGTEGKHGERAVLPEGWAREMARASRVSSGTGMQVERLTFGDDEALGVSDDEGSAFWVIPRRRLAVLNIASTGGHSPPQLPVLLMKGIGTTAASR
jgi:CubicO group peptidase (beta-lactamase class C family)